MFHIEAYILIKSNIMRLIKMVFSRELTNEEKQIILKLEKFVRKAHAQSDSHDYAHVLTVCDNSIKIGKEIEDLADPFVCICGSLLHDIGKTDNTFSHIHGLFGSSIAEEFLDGLLIKKDTTDAICRVIVRHTPTSMIPPETTEEKIVFDADCLDRLGLMGLIRGFLGKEGSMDKILTTYMERRLKDYEKLNFKVSKDMGDWKQQELEGFVMFLQKRLDDRLSSIEDLFEKEGIVSKKVKKK
ncbi:MAG: HD domain-containing protein [Candidatus Lokiarchaeota archaeon]|nr:HD domain-containing protein [Candidatus Lokiarchaeota archaeon]